MSTNFLVWGMVAHMIADWPLQNSWIAVNKVSLKHPASWVHGAIHFTALVFVFSPLVAGILAVAHMLIDTRVPLIWWRRIFHFTGEEPMATHVAIWLDQCAHMLCIAAATQIVARLAGGG